MAQTAIPPGASWDYQVLSSGFNHVIPDGVTACFINPAAILASGTLTMPANPTDGQELSIVCTQVITTLVINANVGQNITGALTAMALNGFGRWKFNQFNLPTPTWIRIG